MYIDEIELKKIEKELDIKVNKKYFIVRLDGK